jgi:hypothetical protein
MNKPKLIIPMLFVCLFTLNGYSQESTENTPRNNYIGIGAGLNKTSVRDQLNTSLPYSGLNLGTVFDFNFSFRKSELQVKNTFSSGKLTPYQSKPYSKNKVTNYYENLDVSYLWNVYNYKPQKVFLFVGPAAMAKIGFRVNDGEIGNSGLTYEGAASLALSAKAEKYFKLKPLFKKAKPGKDFKLGCSMKLPLISQVFTPPYIGLPETLAQERSGMIDIKSNYTGYFSNYFNIELGVSLTYYLKNRNGIELSYFYDYMSTKPKVNPVKTLNQFFSIKLLFNLN